MAKPKKHITETTSISPARASLMLEAARMYFIEDQSRSVIGDALGISRFRVARLIDDARRDGIVKITLTCPDGLDPARATALKQRWKLDRSIVVPTAPDGDLFHMLAEAAASYLAEHVEESDVIGLSSGRTTSRMSRIIGRLPACTLVQIAGVASASAMLESPTETIRRMSQLTAGPSFPIFAPIVLSTVEAAQTLRREPGIADAYAMFSQITKAVVPVGAWEDGESAIHDSVSVADQAYVRESGGVAELLANILNAQGQQVAHGFSDRTIAIPLNVLRDVPDVILVAGGSAKRLAILAALRTGFVNTLITDSSTAQFLMDIPGGMMATDAAALPGAASAAPKRPRPRKAG